MTVPMRRFDGYVFDLDGTVYLDGQVLPGAAEAIATLRRDGARVLFVTNKPLEEPATYAEILSAGGVPAAAADVVTAVDALIAYLDEHHPLSNVLPVAEPVVHRALERAGHRVVTDPADASVVVVSFDRTFDYGKLLAAYRAVCGGAVIVATNPDPYCPTVDGGLPDCAAMLASIEACTGRRADAIVGKPSSYMTHAFLGRLGLPSERAVMVGDRLATDVAMGAAAGMSTVLVVGPDADPSLAAGDIVPDATIATLLDLL